MVLSYGTIGINVDGKPLVPSVTVSQWVKSDLPSQLSYYFVVYSSTIHIYIHAKTFGRLQYIFMSGTRVSRTLGPLDFVYTVHPILLRHCLWSGFGNWLSFRWRKSMPVNLPTADNYNSFLFLTRVRVSTLESEQSAPQIVDRFSTLLALSL